MQLNDALKVDGEGRPDGTTERKHLQRRTKTKLRDAVRELERRRDAGAYVWSQDDVTLAQWLEHWLESVLPMTARWKTLSTYRSQMRVHVIPELGGWRLSELRPELLEQHYRQMQVDGHSAHVIRGVHRILRSSLNEAVRRRRLSANPALVARPPRAEDVAVEPLSVEESRRVLAAAASTLHPARWSIALSLGLRQGEASVCCGAISTWTRASYAFADRFSATRGATAATSMVSRPAAASEEPSARSAERETRRLGRSAAGPRHFSLAVMACPSMVSEPTAASDHSSPSPAPPASERFQRVPR